MTPYLVHMIDLLDRASERDDPTETRGAAHAVSELAREEIGGDEESRVAGAVLTPSGCVMALMPDPEWEAMPC